MKNWHMILCSYMVSEHIEQVDCLLFKSILNMCHYYYYYLTGLVKRGLIRAIINNQKCNFEISNSMYLENEQSYLHVFLHKSVAIQVNSPCLLFTGQLAELSAVLESFFTIVANTHTTSTPIGGGWVGATKWWAKTMFSLNTAKQHPLVPFSPPHVTQNS